MSATKPTVCKKRALPSAWFLEDRQPRTEAQLTHRASNMTDSEGFILEEEKKNGRKEKREDGRKERK